MHDGDRTRKPKRQIRIAGIFSNSRTPRRSCSLAYLRVSSRLLLGIRQSGPDLACHPTFSVITLHLCSPTLLLPKHAALFGDHAVCASCETKLRGFGNMTSATEVDCAASEDTQAPLPFVAATWEKQDPLIEGRSCSPSRIEKTIE